MSENRQYVALRHATARSTRIAHTDLDTNATTRRAVPFDVISEKVTYATGASATRTTRFVGVVVPSIDFPDNTQVTYELLVDATRHTDDVKPSQIHPWTNGLWSTMSQEDFNSGKAFSRLDTCLIVMTPGTKSEFDRLLATLRTSTLHGRNDVSYYIGDDLVTRSFVSICYELGLTLQTVSADKILETFRAKLATDGVLTSQATQEAVVDTFLRRDKDTQLKKNELVPTQMIETIYSYPWYKRSVEKMTEKGYALSQSQQFNVAQVIGLAQLASARCSDNRVFNSNVDHTQLMHNLSDMGSGKTLQTVQAFYVSQQMYAVSVIRSSRIARTVPQCKYTVNMPDSILIMPGMSKQSWLDTFSIFYDVVDHGTHLELTADCGDFVMKTKIHMGLFDIRNDKLYIKQALDCGGRYQWMFIDEMHQLLELPTFASFAKLGFSWKNCSVRHTMVLSGTMSQLTVAQMGRYCRVLNINLTKFQGLGESDSVRLVNTRDRKLRDGWRQYTNEYRSTILDEIENPNTAKPKMTVGETKLHAKYGSIPCRVTDNKFEIVAADIDGSISSANIGLFFDIVGVTVVTADSHTINQELSKGHDRKHESMIINTDTPLTADEVQLLKRIHALSDARRAYGSGVIGQKIQNAILNLNDGLATQSIYDVINESASSNKRFLQYLQAQDMSLLEDLQQSVFINVPELTETDKFKTLQALLQEEPDETYLIVVNDDESMVKLSEALGVKHLTIKSLKDSTQYQNLLNEMYEKQSIVVVPQYMLKASIDLVQVNRLVQYQLNSEVSDMIQSQNRIDRIGQVRDTKAIYIATNQLQSVVIDLFIETYRNVRVAHRGILELFVDMSKQLTVVNGLMGRAFEKITKQEEESDDVPNIIEKIVGTSFRPQPQMSDIIGVPYEGEIAEKCPTIVSNGYLVPEPNNQYDPKAVMVYVPVQHNGQAEWAHVGYLKKGERLQDMVAGYGQSVPCLVYTNAWEQVDKSKNRSVTVEVTIRES